MTRLEFISKLALLDDAEFDNLILIYKKGGKQEVDAETGAAKQVTPEESLREQVINEWPVLANIKFTLQADPDFLVKWKQGLSSIEYIGQEPSDFGKGVVNYSSYPDFVGGTTQIKSKTPGIGTIYYNPKYNDKDNIKLDLLHALADLDPLYRQLRDNLMRVLDLNRARKMFLDNDSDEILTDAVLRSLLSNGKKGYGDPKETADLLLQSKDLKKAFLDIVTYLTKLENPKKYAEEGATLESVVSIEIGDKSYTVQIAKDEQTRKKGLMNQKSLDKDKGMLFIFDQIGSHEMWMKNTLIPLDLIFMNEDQEVLKVITRKPEDETLEGCDGTKYVLEVNANSGIKEGDLMELIEDSDDESPVMKVLAPDGSTQMELWGGERIFSRKNTKVLIRQAKKAYQTKSNSDYKRLGKSIFKFLDVQDSNTPEYVNLPN